MAENEERDLTKNQFFFQKRTAFLSGISIHFRSFVVRYSFSKDYNERDKNDAIIIINFQFFENITGFWPNFTLQ